MLKTEPTTSDRQIAKVKADNKMLSRRSEGREEIPHVATVYSALSSFRRSCRLFSISIAPTRVSQLAAAGDNFGGLLYTLSVPASAVRVGKHPGGSALVSGRGRLLTAVDLVASEPFSDLFELRKLVHGLSGSAV
jgi:hypothetical protein